MILKIRWCSCFVSWFITLFVARKLIWQKLCYQSVIWYRYKLWFSISWWYQNLGRSQLIKMLFNHKFNFLLMLYPFFFHIRARCCFWIYGYSRLSSVLKNRWDLCQITQLTYRHNYVFLALEYHNENRYC